jgi:phosphate/phosphite/phosphonate ABC transporter binding protein
MSKPLFITTLLVGTLLLAGCATATPTPTEEPTEPAATEETPTEVATEEGLTIVIGDIGDDPTEIIEGAQPLADYLAARLSDHGVTRGEVRVAQTDAEMIDMIKNGEVDLYFDSTYPATLIADASGAEPLVRRWRGGVGEYHTVIFATKSSGITSVDDLKGKMVAFDTNLSTSGYLLPLTYFIEHDFTASLKGSPEEPVADDEIGYVFSGADDNTMQWVLNGLVAAGATDNVRYFNRLEEDVRNQLVVVLETESLPRQVGLVRPDIDPELKAAIKDILLKTDQDEEGKAALDAFDGTTKFDDFPEGIEAAFARIRELIEIVQSVEKPTP